MIVLNRTQLILAMAAALTLGIGGGLAIAYRGPLSAWLTGAVESNSQHAAMVPGQDEMSQMDPSQQQMPAAPGSESGDRKVAYWYDPMHPSYRSDKPGIAPDCGMKLVPKYEDELEAMQKMAPGTVQLSAEKQQLIGVRTGQARRDRLTRTLRTTGAIEVDETLLSHVHTKVDGWVEKVYGDFVGKLIRRGQPLFTLYSPELVSTQEEYLIARRGQASLQQSHYANVSEGADLLLRSARERLRLWDISEEQVERLEQTGEVQRTLMIRAPVSGYVLQRDIFPETYVKPDKTLYTIADLSRVWVHVDLYEFEAPYVRTGQPATMQLSYYPGKTFRGRVSYVYPTVDPKTRTVRVRLEFRNPNLELKPEMFADVDLKIDYGTHIVIPSEAVLDSGLRQIVFVVHDGGLFEPRQVELGPKFDGRVAILRGLEESDTIVTSGNFLIDSESKLTAATGAPAHEH